jgi:hypothetical protein
MACRDSAEGDVAAGLIVGACSFVLPFLPENTSIIATWRGSDPYSVPILQYFVFVLRRGRHFQQK